MSSSGFTPPPSPPPPPAQLAPSSRNLLRLLIGLQLLFVLAVLGGGVLTTQRLRQDALNTAQAEVEAQARNFEDYLTQSFTLLSLHLQQLGNENPTSVGFSLEAGNETAQLLVNLQRKLPYLRSLSVTDTGGRIIASSVASNVGVSVELGGFLPQVPISRTGLLRIGGPWEGRDFSNGRPLSPTTGVVSSELSFLTLAITLPERPNRIALAAINSDYFLNYIGRHADLGKARFRLYDYNGVLQLSTARGDLPGRSISSSALLADIQHRELGQYQEVSPQGELQLLAFRASRHYPWFVLADAGERTILQHWRADTNKTFAAMTLALLAFLSFTGLMTRRFHQALTREAKLQEEHRLAASVFQHSSDGITITDQHAVILAVNPAFERITGYAASDVLGKTPRLLASGRHDTAFYTAMWQTLHGQGQWQGEIIDRRKDGELLTESLTITAVRNAAGEVVNYVGVFNDLSRLRRDEAIIRRLSQAVEQSPSSIIITSVEAVIEYANPQFFRSTGYLPEEVLGQNPRILQSGQTPPSTYQAMWANLLAGDPWDGEFINKRKDGALYVERASVAPIVSPDGRVTHYIAIKHDVTEERQTAEALHLAASVIAHTHEGVLVCDAAQRILDVNPAFETITGYTRQEVLGKTPGLLSSGRQGKAFYQAMWQSLMLHGHWHGEFWNRRKDGGLYAALSDVSVVRNSDDAITHYINLFTDITSLKNHQERLELLAHYDPLTRLPNRSLLADRLQQALAKAEREKRWLAICFMDLDGFKPINDTHGHETGDELLVEIARRLQANLRGGDTAARLGGDEFVLLFSDINSLAECEQAANRLLKAVAAPIVIDNKTLQVSASVGITLYPQDSAEAEQLLRHADHAMYQAKQQGRNRYFLYDAHSDLEARTLRSQLDELAAALAADELQLFYQPKINMRQRQVVGFEALIRWQHPQRGVLLPADFLPLLAGSELELELDEWVLQQVLEQMGRWQAASVPVGRISLNLCARSLASDALYRRLQYWQSINPPLCVDDLEFEVLESSAIENLDEAHQALIRWRRLGVRIALDDFGTGYSSLAYLRHLPVHTLKIDQSFVRNMLDNPDDLAIVESVIRLAQAFRRDLVAEGVETKAHGQMLLRMGCEVAQGFCISRPLPADQVAGWLESFCPETLCALSEAGAPTVGEDPSAAVAAMQHRLWVNRLERWLTEQVNGQALADAEMAELELSPLECRFGLWHQWAQTQVVFARHPVFLQLAPRHAALHRLGAEVVAQHRAGHADAALRTMGELYALQQEFLQLLEVLERASAH